MSDIEKRGLQGVQGPSGGQGIQGEPGEDVPGPQGEKGERGERGEGGKYEAIHKWRWRGLIAWIILFSAITFYVATTNRQRSEEGLEAKAALCVVMEDLERRANSTEQFLKDNPGPIVLGTVPRTTLEQSLEDQRRTVELIDGHMDCPPNEGGLLR